MDLTEQDYLAVHAGAIARALQIERDRLARQRLEHYRAQLPADKPDIIAGHPNERQFAMDEDRRAEMARDGEEDMVLERERIEREQSEPSLLESFGAAIKADQAFDAACRARVR